MKRKATGLFSGEEAGQLFNASECCAFSSYGQIRSVWRFVGTTSCL